MLPPKATQLLGKYLQFCSFLHIFPFAFKWDPSRKIIEARFNGLTVAAYWIVEAGMISYQTFLLYRAEQIASTHVLPLSVKVKALYMILSFVGMSYNRLVFIYHQNELPELIKGFIDTPRKFAGKLLDLNFVKLGT